MRWTLTAIASSWAALTKTLALTTDIPTHLWLLWSLIPPKRAITQQPARGSFCRVGEFLWPWPLRTVEQNEAGLTADKSFTWGPWPEGQTRYYTFYPDPTAQTGHSTTAVFSQTAMPDLWGELLATNIHLFSDFSSFLQNVVGSGFTTRAPLYLLAQTGLAPNSLAVAYTQIFPIWRIHAQRNEFDADYPMQICFFGAFDGLGVESTRYAWMRCSADMTAGDLSQAGWGWRWHRDGFLIYAQTHDGVGLESTLVTPPGGFWLQLMRLLIVHDPPTQVRFYINGILVATHTTRVPSGFVPAPISIGAENPATAMSQSVFCNRIIFKSDWRG